MGYTVSYNGIPYVMSDINCIRYHSMFPYPFPADGGLLAYDIYHWPQFIAKLCPALCHIYVICLGALIWYTHAYFSGLLF